jgi:hypothetical protein
VSRLARNEFIRWQEMHEDAELERSFAMCNKDLFDKWQWERFEEWKRDAL